MNFSGTIFLFCFLPLTLLLYYALPTKAKNPFLLFASLLFYWLGDPKHLPLLLGSALLNYLFGRLLTKFQKASWKKTVLVFSIVWNLSFLALFKYADFVLNGIAFVTGRSLPLIGLSLPVGISFYTFQAMSYTLDVYRGQAKVQKSLLSFALYLCLFPQLIAGPIVRYGEIADEIDHRNHSFEKTADGILRFAVGLSKKVLLANQLGELVKLYQNSTDSSLLFAWMAAVAYTLQIYFDFSGYSDMAIGIGKMLGFHFPENFDYPYLAASITEFWRRWHKTLSGWFRDYVYIPLGGNRKGRGRQILYLLLVWGLTGLWHGAALNFLLWGLLYGCLLIVEKLFLLKFLEKHPAFGHFYTLLFVVLGFVLFGASSFSELLSEFSDLFGLSGIALVSTETLYYGKSYGILLLICLLGATPLPKKMFQHLPQRAKSVVEPILLLGSLLLVTAYQVDGSFNPFLYFRF